jgi:hypothetical protein
MTTIENRAPRADRLSRRLPNIFAVSRASGSHPNSSASAVGQPTVTAETVRIRPPDLPGNSCARQGQDRQLLGA